MPSIDELDDAALRGAAGAGAGAAARRTVGEHGEDVDEAIGQQLLQRGVGVARNELGQIVGTALAVDHDQGATQPRRQAVHPGLDLGLAFGCLAVDRRHLRVQGEKGHGGALDCGCVRVARGRPQL